jgi:hypothetical protein
MQKLTYFVFFGLGLFVLFQGLHTKPIFLQDAYQEALQAQLKRQQNSLYESEMQILEESRHYTSGYYQDNEIMEGVDSLLIIYKEWQESNYMASADTLSKYSDDFVQAQKNIISDLFSKRVPGVDPNAVTPQKINKVINGFYKVTDSVRLRSSGIHKSKLVPKLGKIGQTLIGNSTEEYSNTRVGWKEVFYGDNFSPAQIRTSGALADKTQFLLLCGNIGFLLDKISRMATYYYGYSIHTDAYSKILKKGEKYATTLTIFSNGHHAFSQVDTLWINGKIQPLRRLIQLIPEKEKDNPIAVKISYHHPYLHTKYMYEDTIYYDALPTSKPQ